MKISLSGKRILVSGDQGALGKGVVKILRSQGAEVIGVDRHAAAIDYEHHGVDLTNPEASRELIEHLAKNGGLDGLVLLVGGYASGDILATDRDTLQRMYQLNFETAFFLVQAALPHLPAGGRIVLTGARPALEPAQAKPQLAYALSKSLIFRVAEVINVSYQEENIVAAVVTPSTIDTPANREAMPEADFDKWVTPDRIGKTIAFFLSDAGSVLRDPVLKVYGESV